MAVSTLPMLLVVRRFMRAGGANPARPGIVIPRWQRGYLGVWWTYPASRWLVELSAACSPSPGDPRWGGSSGEGPSLHRVPGRGLEHERRAGYGTTLRPWRFLTRVTGFVIRIRTGWCRPPDVVLRPHAGEERGEAAGGFGFGGGEPGRERQLADAGVVGQASEFSGRGGGEQQPPGDGAAGAGRRRGTASKCSRTADRRRTGPTDQPVASGATAADRPGGAGEHGQRPAWTAKSVCRRWPGRTRGRRRYALPRPAGPQLAPGRQTLPPSPHRRPSTPGPSPSSLPPEAPS